MSNKIYVFIFMCVFPRLVAAQGHTIHGKVISSSNGAPLSGVSVTAYGPTKMIGSASTNAEGIYSLSLSSEATNLQFTYIGMQTLTIKINGRTFIDATLFENQSELNEVVVVGYGTQKKASVIGSVVAVSGKEVLTTKNENVLNSLAGKVPGLRIAQKTSEPGSFNTVFDIRGYGRNPLVVIDGVQRDNISTLDANDIESISVLKDASAAIYGVRAADGVILVTTKSGHKGKPSLTYSGYYGIQNPASFESTVNAVDFMTLMNEKLKHNLENPTVKYTDEDFEQYANGTKKTTDWYAPVFDRTVPEMSHSITATGGSDDISYFLSLGNLKQDGFWKSRDLNYKKYNFRSNVSAKIAKGLTAEMRLSGIKDTKMQPWTDTWNLFKSLFSQLPTLPVYANNDPAYPGGVANGNNPIVNTSAEQSGYKNYDNLSFQGAVSLNYEIPSVNGLSAKALFSYDYNSTEYKGYRKPYDLYTYDTESKVYRSNVFGTPMSVFRSFNRGSENLIQLALNYNHQFGKHGISGMITYEELFGKGDNFSASRELAFAIDQLFAGNTYNQTGTQDANGLTDWSRKSVIGRVNYDFGDRYLAEFSFRYDGSSKFRDDQQWGFFSAGLIGWRISEEPFFKNSEALSFIDNLKLKATYGVLGNDDAVNYQFLSGYNFPSGRYIWNGVIQNGLSDKGLANTQITWFTYQTANIGVDLDMWKQKLGISLDIFRRDGNDLLGNRLGTLPGTVGASLPQENLNSDRTQGIELTLSHKNTLGRFGYSVTGNIAYARTKLRFQEVGAYGNAYDNWRNNPTNRYNDIWWGLGYDGQFQSLDEIYQSPVNYGGGNRALLPGDYKYTDWNEDGIIDGWDDHPIATRGVRLDDVTQRNIPKINYGFTLAANYRGFDLNLLFQGAAMTYVDYPEQLKEPLAFGGNASALQMFMDRWHPEDPNADPFNPSTKWVKGYFAYTGTVPASNSERSVQNASYLRLKSVELGYSLAASWIAKIGMQQARIYLNGYNLLTFTGIRGLDPEHTSDLYGYTYPMNKTYNLGLTITF